VDLNKPARRPSKRTRLFQRVPSIPSEFRTFFLSHWRSIMAKKPAPTAPARSASGLPLHGTIPVPFADEPHHHITSPDVVHDNDRMKRASKPNDGEPLSHRNRGKAGRKG
jgi:hypothetical protein